MDDGPGGNRSALPVTGKPLELEQHIPALRRYAWVLTRGSDEADDLVQDCLERALAKGGSYGGRGELKSWLLSILHNLFISGRRRAALRAHPTLEPAMEPPVDGRQESLMEMRQVLAALDALSEEQRAVLVLVGVEDLSYEETACALGLPIGTVMSRLSRGRERLRQIMADGASAGQLRVVR